VKALYSLFFCCFLPLLCRAAAVQLGIDVFLTEERIHALKGKRVGLITNHTGVDSHRCSTIDLLLREQDIQLTALFAPEHGIHGHAHANEAVTDKKGPKGIPVYSLYGKTRRPTAEMLSKVDVLIYDIQDIGCRSYTYTTTLFYVMEEAAKAKIPVIVLDRPNPINGLTVDGPMLSPEWRSYIGYINIPYCHGMTIGELALFFNATYHIGCKLEIVKMKGWKRSMSFADTGLTWIPTSPYIPETDTPYYYASTGLLGELSLVNIGIGYTLPFKVIGAPWIRAEPFAEALNAQKLPGAAFIPFHYRPFYGAYQGKECQGVIIAITNPATFRPVTTQWMILGLLKNLYPKQVLSSLKAASASKKELFSKACGSSNPLALLEKEPYVAWKLIALDKEERARFLEERKRYLLYP
jgi:uncharacterized protein YbbC (DUF1343 family)